MGGAPIGAGGHDSPLLEAKGTGGHNLGIIHISHCSYHAFIYTNVNAANIRINELGWLSYLSNILSPLAKKWGVKNIFCSLRSQNLPPPTFKTVALPMSTSRSCRQTLRQNTIADNKVFAGATPAVTNQLCNALMYRKFTSITEEDHSSVFEPVETLIKLTAKRCIAVRFRPSLASGDG